MKGSKFVFLLVCAFIAVMDPSSSVAGNMRGWSVRICPQTEATRIGLQSGPTRQNNSVWGEWVRGKSRNEIQFPKTHQSLGSIYFQANNYEGKEVELCVLFDGKVKKHFSFGGQHAWHIIERSDSDNCPCNHTP